MQIPQIKFRRFRGCSFFVSLSLAGLHPHFFSLLVPFTQLLFYSSSSYYCVPLLRLCLQLFPLSLLTHSLTYLRISLLAFSQKITRAKNWEQKLKCGAFIFSAREIFFSALHLMSENLHTKEILGIDYRGATVDQRCHERAIATAVPVMRATWVPDEEAKVCMKCEKPLIW